MVDSEFYYSLLDSFSIVAVTDKDGKIIYANDKFCEISQYSREELIGNTHRIVNSGYHSREFFKNLWDTVSSGRMWRGEIRNKTKNGDYYWVDSFVIPQLDENQNVKRYYSIRVDITERKKQELEVLKQKEELEKIAVIHSHQVRRPVANIIGIMNLFEHEELKDCNRQLYNLLKQSVKELESSIEHIVKKVH